MLLLGFSTGALAFGNFAHALDLLEQTDANAVEVSALRSSELNGVLRALPGLIDVLRKRYSYISFHAPTDFTDEVSLVKQLAEVARLGLNIIVHPDTVHDVVVWRELDHFLCLENMDSRKSTGRTAMELQQVFELLPRARLCFDIAHARDVDPSMGEASRILSVFGDKLAQVHLSELANRGKHIGLSKNSMRDYAPFSGILASLPVIIESVISEDLILNEIREAEELLGFKLLDVGIHESTRLT